MPQVSTRILINLNVKKFLMLLISKFILKRPQQTTIMKANSMHCIHRKKLYSVSSRKGYWEALNYIGQKHKFRTPKTAHHEQGNTENSTSWTGEHKQDTKNSIPQTPQTRHHKRGMQRDHDEPSRICRPGMVGLRQCCGQRPSRPISSKTISGWIFT